MSVIAIASMLAAQSTVTLAFQPKIGATYKQATTMTQTSAMGNSSTSMTTTTKVMAFEGGFFKLQNTPSNVKVTGAGGDQVKKAMEKQSVVYMDKHFKPKMSGGPAGMSNMMSGMNNAFSGITFPSKPVKVGESWTNVIDMGALMGAAMKSSPQAAGVKSSGKINLSYKLLKADASTVTIGMTISGTINMDMSGARGAAAGQSMKMSMTMSGGGSSVMERNTGIPISSNTKMSMKMGGGGPAFSMDQTIVTKRP